MFGMRFGESVPFPSVRKELCRGCCGNAAGLTGAACLRGVVPGPGRQGRIPASEAWCLWAWVEIIPFVMGCAAPLPIAGSTLCCAVPVCCRSSDSGVFPCLCADERRGSHFVHDIGEDSVAALLDQHSLACPCGCRSPGLAPLRVRATRFAAARVKGGASAGRGAPLATQTCARRRCCWVGCDRCAQVCRSMLCPCSPCGSVLCCACGGQLAGAAGSLLCECCGGQPHGGLAEARCRDAAEAALRESAAAGRVRRRVRGSLASEEGYLVVPVSGSAQRSRLLAGLLAAVVVVSVVGGIMSELFCSDNGLVGYTNATRLGLLSDDYADYDDDGLPHHHQPEYDFTFPVQVKWYACGSLAVRDTAYGYLPYASLDGVVVAVCTLLPIVLGRLLLACTGLSERLAFHSPFAKLGRLQKITGFFFFLSYAWTSVHDRGDAARPPPAPRCCCGRDSRGVCCDRFAQWAAWLCARALWDPQHDTAQRGGRAGSARRRSTLSPDSPPVPDFSGATELPARGRGLPGARAGLGEPLLPPAASASVAGARLPARKPRAAGAAAAPAAAPGPRAPPPLAAEEFSLTLYHALPKDSAWIDRRSLDNADDIATTTVACARDACYCVLHITPKYVTSPNCLVELLSACERPAPSTVFVLVDASAPLDWAAVDVSHTPWASASASPSGATGGWALALDLAEVLHRSGAFVVTSRSALITLLSKECLRVEHLVPSIADPNAARRPSLRGARPSYTGSVLSAAPGRPGAADAPSRRASALGGSASPAGIPSLQSALVHYWRRAPEQKVRLPNDRVAVFPATLLRRLIAFDVLGRDEQKDFRPSQLGTVAGALCSPCLNVGTLLCGCSMHTLCMHCACHDPRGPEARRLPSVPCTVRCDDGCNPVLAVTAACCRHTSPSGPAGDAGGGCCVTRRGHSCCADWADSVNVGPATLSGDTRRRTVACRVHCLPPVVAVLSVLALTFFVSSPLLPFHYERQGMNSPEQAARRMPWIVIALAAVLVAQALRLVADAVPNFAIGHSQAMPPLLMAAEMDPNLCVFVIRGHDADAGTGGSEDGESEGGDERAQPERGSVECRGQVGPAFRGFVEEEVGFRCREATYDIALRLWRVCPETLVAPAMGAKSGAVAELVRMRGGRQGVQQWQAPIDGSPAVTDPPSVADPQPVRRPPAPPPRSAASASGIPPPVPERVPRTYSDAGAARQAVASMTDVSAVSAAGPASVTTAPPLARARSTPLGPPQLRRTPSMKARAVVALKQRVRASTRQVASARPPSLHGAASGSSSSAPGAGAATRRKSVLDESLSRAAWAEEDDGPADDEDADAVIAGESNTGLLRTVAQESGLLDAEVERFDCETRLRVVAHLLDVTEEAVADEARELAVILRLQPTIDDVHSEWQALLFPNCFVFCVETQRDASAYHSSFMTQFRVCQTLLVDYGSVLNRPPQQGPRHPVGLSVGDTAVDTETALRSVLFEPMGSTSLARRLLQRLAAKIGALVHRPRLGAEFLDPWFLTSATSPLVTKSRAGAVRLRPGVAQQVRQWRSSVMSGVFSWHTDADGAAHEPAAAHEVGQTGAASVAWTDEAERTVFRGPLQ